MGTNQGITLMLLRSCHMLVVGLSLNAVAASLTRRKKVLSAVIENANTGGDGQAVNNY